MSATTQADARRRRASSDAPSWERVIDAHATPGAPTRVVLVRHGETDWNARGIYQGWSDEPLGARGRAQVEALAGSLAEVPFDAAYTSPLRRARETATILLAGRGVAPLALPALRELTYGRCEGVLPDVRASEWPALDRHWTDDPWSVTFPDGESLEMLSARVLPAWARLLEAHAGDTVLVSAHGHVNRLLLLHARALARDAFWSVEQRNASAVFLEYHQERGASWPR